MTAERGYCNCEACTKCQFEPETKNALCVACKSGIHKN